MTHMPGAGALQRKFLTMQEIPFTKDVVLPLLEAMGFSLDAHGGSYEAGKDIIFWKTDEFGDVECGVAQVKKFKAVVSTRKSNSFSDLIYQLQQASEKSVPYLDGQRYVPKRILFITPYPVNARALESRFEKFSQLVANRTTILDGPKLAALLLKECPEVAERLVGHHVSITSATLASLSNDVLMRALGSALGRSVQDFYCDLEFTVGKRTNHVLHRGYRKPETDQLAVSAGDVGHLAKLDQALLRLTGVQFLTAGIPQIEAALKRRHDELHEEATQRVLPIMVAEMKTHGQKRGQQCAANPDVSAEWRTQMDAAWKQIDALEAEAARLFDAKSNRIGQWVRRYIHVTRLLRDDRRWLRSPKRLRQCVERIFLRIMELARSGKPSVLLRVRDKCSEALTLAEKYNEFMLSREPVSVPIETNAAAIAEWFDNWRRQLFESVERVNNGHMSNRQLRALLGGVGEMMALCELMRMTPGLRSMFQARAATGEGQIATDTGEVSVRSDDNKTRLTIRAPVATIFSTRLNLAVFGSAGAGKTTTLQMYAKQLIDKDDGGLVMYVPLASAMQVFRRRSSSYDSSQAPPLDLLLEGVCLMLASIRECGVRPRDLDRVLSGRRAVMLLDGIDEVIKDCPWILSAIGELARRFPSLQVIVSSRLGGDYIEKVPFLGLTLREFTDDQRRVFIGKWFAQAKHVDDPDKRASRIIAHLDAHPRLAEVVRNPLSATILCVIGESDMPLPEHEIQMYRDRMRLMFGEFDVYKHVRRVESRPDFLHVVAVKVAFFLHSHAARHDTLDALTEETVRLFDRKRDIRTIKLAVQELVHPCEVLVPMNVRGDYGFGHLRFQEYLVACEMLSNRNIDIAALVYKPWWRGSLVLLAQMSDDLEFLFEAAHRNENFEKALPTLERIIADKPDGWVDRLDEWLSEQVDDAEADNKQCRHVPDLYDALTAPWGLRVQRAFMAAEDVEES